MLVISKYYIPVPLGGFNVSNTLMTTLQIWSTLLVTAMSVITLVKEMKILAKVLVLMASSIVIISDTFEKYFQFVFV